MYNDGGDNNMGYRGEEAFCYCDTAKRKDARIKMQLLGGRIFSKQNKEQGNLNQYRLIGLVYSQLIAIWGKMQY